MFLTKYKCLNFVKQENEDFVTYEGNVNSQCELFKLGDLSINMYKCLTFTQGFTVAKGKDTRSRILTITKQDPEITPQKVNEEYRRLINVKRDHTRIKEKIFSEVQEIKQPKFTKK